MFLNLSNHPSADWPAAQRASAEAIGGEILDEPFPDVPPEAAEDLILRTGEQLARRLVSLVPAAAMVQGEFTLAFYLVAALESRGIPCYAATTRRAGPESPGFRFVRFRRYPVLPPVPAAAATPDPAGK